MSPGTITIIWLSAGVFISLMFKRFNKWEERRTIARLQHKCKRLCIVNTEMFGPVELKTISTDDQVFIETSVPCLYRGDPFTLTAHPIVFGNTVEGWKAACSLRKQESSEELSAILIEDRGFMAFWNARGDR